MNERALSIGLSAGVLCVGALIAFNVAPLTKPLRAVPEEVPVVGICERSIHFGPTCGPCIAASCCGALDACYASSECIDLNDCTVKCGEEEERGEHAEDCPKECEQKHPQVIAIFRAWDKCATERCGSRCPPRR